MVRSASPNTRDSDLPILILTGSRDERMPIAMIRAYANQMGDEATLVELQADHFMLTKKDKEAQGKIASWLRQQLTLPGGRIPAQPD
jgi:surfactin synthase thioesterase subunit